MTLDMYAEEILERYRHPRNFGRLENPNFVHKEANQLCGDVIEVHVKLDNQNKVADAKFNGQGCAISQASADVLMENIKGKTIDEIKKLNKDFLLKLLGIEIGPVRLKCALLSFATLQIAVNNQ